MPNIWVINKGILYTSNNGCDKLKNPTIPFSEYLEDCYYVGTFVEFNKLANDMIEKEINFLPKNMKDLALNDIKNAKRGYLENAKKGVKYNTVITDTVYSHIAKEKCISSEDAKYIYEESQKIMPILLIQYKTDLNMICLRMKEYQKILMEKCQQKASMKK